MIAWVSTQTAGITSAASQLGSHYVIVGGWIMSTAQATKSAGETVAIWAMLKTDAITSSAAVTGALSTMGTGLAGLAGSVLGSVGMLAGGLYFLSTQVDNTKNAWAISTGAISTATTTSVNWIEGEWQRLATWLNAQDWDIAFFSWVDAVGRWCTKTRTDMYNGAVSFVGSLKQGLIDSFKDPLGWLADQGANILTGFLNGITGGFPDIAGVIKDLGTSIVQGVKDFFGIHSPSTVMAGLGGHIVGGLVKGIISNKDQLPKLLHSVFGDVKQGVSGIISWLGSQGGNLLGDVIGGAGNLGAAFAGALGSGASAPATGAMLGGAAQWSTQVIEALGLLGQPNSLLDGVLRRIGVESGGNPNAINLTDINAQQGHPSQGLMQTIPSTFAAWAGQFASLGITNPLANIYAGLNYALHRYGSIGAIDPLVRPMGYDKGGYLMPKGMGMNYGSQPERVLTPSNTRSFDRMIEMAAAGKFPGGGASGPLDLSDATINRLADAILAGAHAVSSQAVSAGQSAAARDASARRSSGGWS